VKNTLKIFKTKKKKKTTPKNTDENKIKNWHGFCNSSGLANMAKFQTKKK